MALLEVNLAPSQRDLTWFGIIQLAFFGLAGAIVARYSASLDVPVVLWTIGVAVCILYYAVPPLRRTLFVAWMWAVYPLGWVMSHLLMGFIYFGVLTPIGWLLRAFSRDPMQRSVNRDAPTYWVERHENRPAERYFRQY